MKGVLIFNADDYGLSPGVSAGILQSMRGVVRSTTVMGNLVSPAEARALALYQAEHDISIGAHLNLSSGPPLSAGYPAELLRADGCFNKAVALEAETWESSELRLTVCAEWCAQLERIRELGLRIDHLDSHHHTHLLEPLLPMALDFATVLRLPLRSRADSRCWFVASPEHFVEAYFGYNNIGREQLLAALEQVPGGTVEVMCHPGQVDALLRERSGYLSERETELAVLGAAELTAELEERGWRIGAYHCAGNSAGA